MREDFDHFSQEELNSLKEKFFKMKDYNHSVYFDVDEYETLIDFFFINEDIENSELAIKLAIEQHPGNQDFLLKKVQYHAIVGKDEEGLELLNEIAELASDPDYHMIKGTLLSNLRKYKEAIEEYTKALKVGQDLEEVYANIAFEYQNMEQFDKAISYLDKIIDLNPANESALNEIGLCFEISNASKKAVDYFNKFLDKHPYSRSAWFNLAISYNSLGKNEKAIDAYEFSLAIDENQPSAYFNIANIYASMDDHPKAINYYRRTLIKESPDAITYYYLGESYEKLDRFEDALEAYQNAFEINNLFHEALLGMARSYFVLGNEEEAYLKLDDAINVEEPFPLFWSIRSLKMDELGYFELAITAIKKLIDLYPDEIIYVLSLSVLYNPHNAPESIKVLDQAMLRFSDESDQALCMYLKGLYLLKMGQKKEGLLTFESALELDKNEFDNPLIQSEFGNHAYKQVEKLLKKHGL